MKKNDNYVPIKNSPGFVKDMKTGVVINTNMGEYERILEKRKHKRELESLNNELSNIKNELDMLKEMIKGSK